ncbi:MAG: BatD family protein [Candidatus Zixiibacteriota bacterium]
MLLALTMLTAGVIMAQDEIGISVSLDRDTIGLDEQAVLEVVVSGTDQNLPAPQMPTLSMFEVYSQGRSSNISIINGQVSSSISYRYMLLPSKTGTYPIDNIAIVYKNKRYKGNQVELTVLDKGVATSPQLEESAQTTEGDSKDYFLEAVVDKTNPYVGEQVTLTLKFYIAVRYYGTPELKEPTTTGFWTEVLGNQTPYFQKLNNRNYRVIERKYALFPTQTGELTIGRATITTSVATKTARQRDPFNMNLDDFFGNWGQEVEIRSKPVIMNVKPLPIEGRPDDFTGTIGQFSIVASPDKLEVEVNQPVTVTIKISGTGNIKSVAEPIIPDLPDFRIYKASSSEKSSRLNDKIGGTKIYEEVFIPKKPGKLELPSLGFNYFDPQQKIYKVMKTPPLTIDVRQPEGYTGTTEVPYRQTGVVLGSDASDIRFIKEAPGDFTPKGRLVLLMPLYLILNGLFVLVFVGLVVIRLRNEKLSGDVGYARSRQASRMAHKRLARARSLATVEKAGEFYAEISLALLAYMADKLNISPHGLTSQRVADLLKEKKADTILIEQTVAFLKQCDFARFAPASLTQADIDRALDSARQIMVKMEGVKFV